jgi:hypothetical protein
MSLFAMHRNIERIPPHSLSPAVAKALNSYVAWAKDRVPPAQMYRGVTPDSKLDESNPMIGVVDPGKISIQNLPTMDMPVYPVNFKDGTAMQNYETAPYLGELAQEWSRKLEALIPLIIADIK